MSLKSILSEMQEIDPNGEWLHALKEIENGEETKESLIECIIIMIECWIADNADYGSLDYWKLKKLLAETWILKLGL